MDLHILRPSGTMKTAIADKLRNIAHTLGINNKPTYVVMAIAAVKGICRPTFTMMDKKEDPKTKKYTAIREGVTELIAIPVYWGLGELSAKVAKKVLPPELQKKGTKNAMFLGVCVAALLVIPGLCSAAIKPVMGLFYHDNEPGHKTAKSGLNIESEAPKLEIKDNLYSNNSTIIKRPSMQNFTSRAEYGMKVGGV